MCESSWHPLVTFEKEQGDLSYRWPWADLPRGGLWSEEEQGLGKRRAAPGAAPTVVLPLWNPGSAQPAGAARSGRPERGTVALPQQNAPAPLGSAGFHAAGGHEVLLGDTAP